MIFRLNVFLLLSEKSAEVPQHTLLLNFRRLLKRFPLFALLLKRFLQKFLKLANLVREASVKKSKGGGEAAVLLLRLRDHYIRHKMGKSHGGGACEAHVLHPLRRHYTA